MFKEVSLSLLEGFGTTVEIFALTLLGAIPLGSTDAAAASEAGIAAASFVAMDPAPAKYYHTRLDTADILVPDTIEKVIDIALQAVFDFDEGGI